MTAAAQPSVDPIRDMARSVEERLEAADASAIERQFMRVLSRLLAALASFFEDLRAGRLGAAAAARAGTGPAGSGDPHAGPAALPSATRIGLAAPANAGAGGLRWAGGDWGFRPGDGRPCCG